MAFLLIIPLLNENVTLLRGPLFPISENIYVAKLNDIEHSAFHRYGDEEIKQFIHIDETKCLKVTFNADPSENDIVLQVNKLSFLLNFFARDFPIVFKWAAVLEGTSKLVVKQIQVFDTIANLNDYSERHFRVRPGISRQTIIKFYKKLHDAIISDPNAILTIRRFNLSLLRTDFYDKLIDTTICLESLVPGTSELIFKFSLYLSLITKDNAINRDDCFKKLNSLYEVRSRIVHGEFENNTAAKIETIKQNWQYYDEVLRSALTYYLIFVSSNTRKKWKDHLLNITIGTEQKIIL
jgi:hypothetical protein